MIAGFSVLDSEFLMEPKQQEIVGYRVLPFAFLSKLPTLIFPKKRKVVSWRFHVTTDEFISVGEPSPVGFPLVVCHKDYFPLPNNLQNVP